MADRQFARGRHLQFLPLRGAEAVSSAARARDPDLLQEKAQDLFESWWAADASSGQWNEEVKQRLWTSLWQEFGRHSDQR